MDALTLHLPPAPDPPDPTGTADQSMDPTDDDTRMQPGTPAAHAADRLCARIPGGRAELDTVVSIDGTFKQQSLTQLITTAEADTALKEAEPLDMVSSQAHRAPGACRWLLTPPTVTNATPTSSSLFACAAKLMLGITTPLTAHNRLCRFCGALRGTRGIHDLSCMAGGDVVRRHNGIRDIIFGFASRGCLNPELERTGLLAEQGVLLDLRRPADVLINAALHTTAHTPNPPSPAKTALDIKIINALGATHRDATRLHPLGAAEAYHNHALEHQQTERLCAQQGVLYVPVVFTAQGGISKRAEAILHQIANAIARVEVADEASVYADIANTISHSLAASAARAVSRRQKEPVARVTTSIPPLADDPGSDSD